MSFVHLLTPTPKEHSPWFTHSAIAPGPPTSPATIYVLPQTVVVKKTNLCLCIAALSAQISREAAKANKFQNFRISAFPRFRISAFSVHPRP